MLTMYVTVLQENLRAMSWLNGDRKLLAVGDMV
ncbi:DNA polymerase I [Novimethylophilus kurashikiensis]|uniref:DNA polymerase I n=1 Tax=Novimethylophilus kurashikiensis TaxID=1825523 RepID=A0A2R5FAY9_9PROT|nr:DNA polymerase I [Novimethylophilus kurashikiensis]